mmetsp:Transcript_1098/g.3764  ORF Transcript_1098/g.3764 Transcript_1098/m.3764 type:complete len:220 (+) Transcript_1098:1814-2473(+)
MRRQPFAVIGNSFSTMSLRLWRIKTDRLSPLSRLLTKRRGVPRQMKCPFWTFHLMDSMARQNFSKTLQEGHIAVILLTFSVRIWRCRKYWTITRFSTFCMRCPLQQRDQQNMIMSRRQSKSATKKCWRSSIISKMNTSEREPFSNVRKRPIPISSPLSVNSCSKRMAKRRHSSTFKLKKWRALCFKWRNNTRIPSICSYTESKKLRRKMSAFSRRKRLS